MVGLCALLIGCGGSPTSNHAANPNAPEKNPPGDIPDTQVYVPYAAPGGGYVIKVPEGWSRRTSGAAVIFTANLNSVRLQSRAARAPVTVAHARAQLSRLARTVRGFQRPGSVGTVLRPAGTAVKITYLAAGARNPVTGKAVTDAVETYLFFHRGREVIVTLSGPKGADNVDPWRTITGSLRWKA